MGSARPAPGGNTRICRRVVFAIAASAVFRRGNRTAQAAGMPRFRYAAPREDITQKTS
jgi:hypothetical protein